MTNTTIQQALSLLLTSLGFETMARVVLTEADEERLAKYGRIVRHNAAKRGAEFVARVDRVLEGFGMIRKPSLVMTGKAR